MLTQTKIREAVAKIAPLYGISQVYLFGSYARGDATEESDVDFRVVGGNFPTLMEIGGLYEDLMGVLDQSVDIVITGNMSSEFYSRIKDDEVLVYGSLQ
jgi:predicted nucleotidyltransferase